MNFKNLTNFATVTALLLISISMFAMQKEISPISEYLTISNSAMPLFMRIREGNEPNIRVIKNDASANQYTIPNNEETFLFPKNTKIKIKLSSINWPLRVRWWAAEDKPNLGIKKYQPTADINNEKESINTSPANSSNSLLAYQIPQDLTQDKRYLDLYIAGNKLSASLESTDYSAPHCQDQF